MTIPKETQETIILAFIKNSYLYSISKDEMTDGYFSDPACKTIYKALSVYYDKYKTTPGLSELLIVVEECWYPTIGVQLNIVKDLCCKLYDLPEPNESFIKDKITDFIRKVKTSVALQNFVEKLKIDPNLESDGVASELIKALDVSLGSTKLFTMTDMDQIREARVSAVGSEDQSKVIKTTIPSLNASLMFGGWQPGTINMVVAPPGTGKSMFLINEGVNAAKQDFKVLHIFIGDMVEYDGFIRYLSCISGTPQNTLVTKSIEEQYNLVNLCNQQYDNIFSKFYILAYPSLSITVDTLVEDINKFEKQLNIDFDEIIIDYPDNLIQNGRSLYEDGGTLYSSLERLARLSRAVVLVASQPGKSYWNSEILSLDSAAESSKKQQCVDIVLGMNTASRGCEVGTFHLSKARKGTVGKLFRFKSDFARCRIEEIDEGMYQAIKSTQALGVR